MVAPEDLVLLKRTNRPGDYEAVSNLVRLRAEESPDDPRVLKWCLANTFDVDDLLRFVRSATGRLKTLPLRPSIRALLPDAQTKKSVSAGRRARALRLLALEAAEVQERGRKYWLPLLRDLRRLRSEAGLIPPGTPVSELQDPA